jgi:hypothetical protein
MSRGRRSSRTALHIEIFLLLALAGMTCERGMLERVLVLSVVTLRGRKVLLWLLLKAKHSPLCAADGRKNIKLLY